jgi:pyruvate kinase
MTTLKKKSAPATTVQDTPWNKKMCQDVLLKLWDLRTSMLDLEARYSTAIDQAGVDQRSSARNLIHYLALRSSDQRELQEKLSWIGVSSLGRAESHALANVDKVIGILHRLTGQAWQDHSVDEPNGSVTGRKILKSNADRLFGAASQDREVRIMVTLPSEAASDYSLVKGLVSSGMDVARINCAHDDAKAWRAMAKLVRRAAKDNHREVKILMDLAGPKIRTGSIECGPQVLKLKPMRDSLGHAIRPSRLLIGTQPSKPEPLAHDAFIQVDDGWLSKLCIGKQIHLTDARGKKRNLLVVESANSCFIAECLETYYLTSDTALSFKGKHGHKVFTSYPEGIAPLMGEIRLHLGDSLELAMEGSEEANSLDTDQSHLPVARIACTMPEIFGQVKSGERVWFDDGRIGGVVRKTSATSMEVEVTQARGKGESLSNDKGINFPDSYLDLPSLTAKDLDDLRHAVQLADMVGLSFVQEPSDVVDLLKRLQALGAEKMGIVLKIETQRGFENLPGLMLAAMAASAAGVMIARGDLAVECGYERMSEIQEEILWCSEAAHMPVIWATQVLEDLAKSGIPSRAEISDASMGVRAECVMLNKGPYIEEAIQMLDGILKRMTAHQSKKKSLLRALHSWEFQGAQ